MKILCVKIISVILTFAFLSCNEKQEQGLENNSTKDFTWKSELKVSDIPDTAVKGFINGKEVNLAYINFEQWRGSGDNVLNFGDVVPKNNCGYVEGSNSFHLMLKSGEIKTGEILKATFDQNLDGYVAYYDTANADQQNNKKSLPWNCVLVITSMDEKTVSGKIALCFKDDMKSWIAGKFQAIRCYN